MANATTSRQCSKCKQNIGSFNCEGCREIFCTKHSLEHRQELCTRFEQLMTEHNVILQQMNDKKQQNESLKKDFSCRIDAWENNMIEEVRERAKQVRQQLDEFINNRDITIICRIQPLADEIRTRYEKEDFFERDIERIKQTINQVQQEVNQSIQEFDNELYIEPNHRINWKDLIYIKPKSNAASSSVTSKQVAGKNSKGTESTKHSSLIQDPFTYVPSSYNQLPPFPPPFVFPRGMNPSYIQIIRPSNEHSSIANVPSYPYQLPLSTASNSSSTSIQPEKRQRKPLPIVNPVSHKIVEKSTSSSFVNTNHISSQVEPVDDTSRPSSSNLSSATDKAKKQEEFRHQFAKLLTDRSNT